MSSPEQTLELPVFVFQKFNSKIASASKGLLPKFAKKLCSEGIIGFIDLDNVSSTSPEDKAVALLLERIVFMLKSAKNDEKRKDVFDATLKVMDGFEPLNNVAEQMRKTYKSNKEKDEHLHGVMSDMSDSLPGYIVDQYIRLLAIIDVKMYMKSDWLSSEKFLELYSTHVSNTSPQVAASYVYKILTGLWYGEMIDFRSYLYIDVEIDTKITKELALIQKKRYKEMRDELNSLIPKFTSEAIGSLNEVKGRLSLIRQEADWKREVEAVTDKTSLAQLLQRYCFLSNLSLLKYIAEKLDLEKSKSRIDQLAKERDAFYSGVLAEDFADAAIEDHEMIKEHHVEMTVVVSWISSKTTLARFEDYITKEFKDLSMFIALRAVHHGCLKFLCTAPIWAAMKDVIKYAAFSIGIQRIMLDNEDICKKTDIPKVDAEAVQDKYPINYNDEIVYRMNKSPRGYCLIIHMSGRCTEEYPNGDREPGNSEDVKNLEKLFTKLKFVVKNYPNLTKGEIDQLMKNVKEASLEWSCCFVVFILAHGGINSDGSPYFLVPKEEIHNGEDEENTKYQVSIIKEQIEKHPHLVGKPKLLFIQTCRGHEKDFGVPEMADNPPPPTEPNHIKGLIPTGSDLLIAFPTIEKYVAWRGQDGTRFILSLYYVFNKYHERYDVLTMMTIVTKKVADMFGATKKKQNPAITSTLRKFLYFGQPPSEPKSVYEDQDLCNEKAVKPSQ